MVMHRSRLPIEIVDAWKCSRPGWVVFEEPVLLEVSLLMAVGLKRDDLLSIFQLQPFDFSMSVIVCYTVEKKNHFYYNIDTMILNTCNANIILQQYY